MLDAKITKFAMDNVIKENFASLELKDHQYFVRSIINRSYLNVALILPLANVIIHSPRREAFKFIMKSRATIINAARSSSDAFKFTLAFSASQLVIS